MKKTSFILTLLLTLTFSQFSYGEKVIERPRHGLMNTATIEIDKVILTDTATVLFIDAYFRPNWWIRIDTETYIVADGKKHVITGSKDIALNEEHYMPESGEDHFQLYFPAIPENTKSIDFIESDCETCFKIWDIDLTGKAKAYKPDIPGNLLNPKEDKNFVLENSEIGTKKTKFTLYLRGLRDGYEVGEPEMVFLNFLTGSYDEIVSKKSSDGKYEFEFDLSVPSAAYTRFAGHNESIYLEPGENAELYVDMTAKSMHNSRYNPEPDLAYKGFKGKYAPLIAMSSKYQDRIQDYFPNIYENYDILDLDAAEFTDYIFEQYHSSLHKLESESGFPEALQAVIKGNMQIQVIRMLTSMQDLYRYMYFRKHELDSFPEDMEFPSASEKEYMRLKEFDLNNPVWLNSQHLEVTQLLALNVPFELLDQITGSDSGLAQDIKKSIPAFRKAVSMSELTPEEDANLNSTSIPFYAEAYRRLLEQTEQEYEQAMSQGGFIIRETPDVEADKIVEAIVAEYKGKPVFVDFWATWCGPCLYAMKTMKPLKETMAEKGVVSIFISNASSPHAKWAKMLPDIGGIHYYLNQEQWKELSGKYEIQGIPSYLIFDKEGYKSFQTTGYPGNDKMEEELSLVW